MREEWMCVARELGSRSLASTEVPRQLVCLERERDWFRGDGFILYIYMQEQEKLWKENCSELIIYIVRTCLQRDQNEYFRGVFKSQSEILRNYGHRFYIFDKHTHTKRDWFPWLFPLPSSFIAYHVYRQRRLPSRSSVSSESAAASKWGFISFSFSTWVISGFFSSSFCTFSISSWLFHAFGSTTTLSRN